MNYSGRVHCDLSEQMILIQRFESRCDAMIVYRHESQRPHIHLLLVNVNCSYDTLVNDVKKVIPGAKKTTYSFKTGADDNFISYMSKGNLDPVYNKGFSDDLVAEKKSLGYDGKTRDSADEKTIKVEIVALKNEKTKSKTQFEMVSEIVDLYDSKVYNYDNLYSSTVSILKQNKKGGDIFYVMKIMEMVCMYNFPDNHKDLVRHAWNLRHRINF